MKLIFTIAAFIFLGSSTQAQGILNKMKKGLGKDSSKVENILSIGKGNTGLSKDEIISGLKEALTVGTNNSTTAIKGMTITDGLNILKGPNDAATQYLKTSTTTQLTEKMRPVIENSLAKVNATQYWKDVFTAYNKFSKTPVDTDLSSYVTQKSMAGIFYSIAEEEQKIRTNPAAQISPLLKKVFGK